MGRTIQSAVLVKPWVVAGGLTFAAFSSTGAFAQEERPEESRSSRFLRFIDRNGDGSIDPEEMERMPPPFRERLTSAGIPLDRTHSIQGLSELLESERPQENSTPGESGEKKSEETPGAQPAQPSGTTPGGPPGSPTEARHDDRGRPAGHSSPLRRLPESHGRYDVNRDNQIGLYEWPRDKRAEFLLLDRNRDGFLTPSELQPNSLAAASRGVPTAATPTASGAAPPVTNGPTTPATNAPPSTPGTTPTASTPQPPAKPSPLDEEGKRSFQQLDANKDGQLTADEWRVSRRLRPQFEKIGANLSQPMSQEQFLGYYRQARSNG